VTRDDDVLQRSMAAAPEEWLDRLVTDRVLGEVRQQCALRRALTSAEPEPHPVPRALASLAHGR
jgi:hypothetical protein